MTSLFIFLLIAFFCNYRSKPKNKAHVWRIALFIPLTCLMIGAFATFVQSTNAYAGGGAFASMLLPAIISGIIIFFQQKKKLTNNGETKFPVILFICVVVSLGLSIYGYTIKEKNEQSLYEYMEKYNQEYD